MAYPFAAAEVLTAVDLNAMIGAPTQNAITTVTYTAVLLDAGKTVTLSNASAVTLTIPAQASVSWADNTQLNFLNLGAGTVTITPAAGVTINGTPLTLETSKGGSLVRTASNTWTFIPFSSGDGTPGAANFTNAASGDYVSGGISYKYITFTGSGSLVVDQAGFADILVVGGGGGGGKDVFSAARFAGGGGGGGMLVVSSGYLPSGTLTVTVGAGGAGAGADGTGGMGVASALQSFIAPGGGGGGGHDAGRQINGANGGSGGGMQVAVTGKGITGLGFDGGSGGGVYQAGGGGGAGEVGDTGGVGYGGDGLENLFTNASIFYGGGGAGMGSAGSGSGGSGGGGARGVSGVANTGGGGGGERGTPGNGGSGLVIVRVVV